MRKGQKKGAEVAIEGGQEIGQSRLPQYGLLLHLDTLCLKINGCCVFLATKFDAIK